MTAADKLHEIREILADHKDLEAESPGAVQGYREGASERPPRENAEHVIDLLKGRRRIRKQALEQIERVVILSPYRLSK